MRQSLIIVFFIGLLPGFSIGQLVINEGSNKNYSTISDEDGDYEDWIEIYNAGTNTIDLFNYSLSDNSNPRKWVFPHQRIGPNEYILVFCSGKNKFATSAFTQVISDTTFQPQSGWNTHRFTTPFFWDGVSNLVLNLCTFNPFWTNNSIHAQTATAYHSSITAVNEPGSACGYTSGGLAQQRPNIRLNTSIVGTGTIQNGYTDYPSAYSNWYGSSKQQYLYRASELLAAGLTPGAIDSLAFDVIAPCPTSFASLELSLANTGYNSLLSQFIPSSGNWNHTNFKISSGGEIIRLYDPSGGLLSALKINCGPGYDVSIGLFPNASATVKKSHTPTPRASNNTAIIADQYVGAPVFSRSSGVYASPFSVQLTNPEWPDATIYYTLDGHDPDTTSLRWNGTAIPVSQTTILRAKSFKTGFIPSTVTTASYLFNISHTTPIISVVSDPGNLFGPTGLFDNPALDLLKSASVDYFDSTSRHQLVVSRRAGIIMDGGWGSRGQPQRPFRIKWDDGVLGQGPVVGNFIPDRPHRNQYSDFYLRNGSNQFLVLPHKDAAQVKMMAEGSTNYYAAWRPVTVYVNGMYWGLYELREKFDSEMFMLAEKASENSVEILSSSAQYGFQLRAVEGDVQHFYDAYNAFALLNPTDTAFWTKADRYFDMAYYIDYIIGELWMNNADWAANYNNLKIYRSDATDNRWRYCLMDLEYGLLPNPQQLFSCSYDLLSQLLNDWQVVSPGNPHLSIFWKGIQNDRFRNYFINRFADLMNTAYQPLRLQAIEDAMYRQTLPEMPNQFRRWGDPNDVPGQLAAFGQNHQQFRDELACRPAYARDYIQSNFLLPKQVSIQLDVFPREAGQIHISTIRPETYPWQGIYFDGVPIRLEALAKPGYRFSHWEPNGLIADTLNRIYLDTVSRAQSLFLAHFVPAYDLPPTSLLVYPNPASSQVFIQSYADLGDAAAVFVYDMVGRRISLPFTPIGTKKGVLSISSLSAGYYMVQYVSKNGKTYQGRLIKR
jgi:hypothetical protein